MVEKYNNKKNKKKIKIILSRLDKSQKFRGNKEFPKAQTGTLTPAGRPQFKRAGRSRSAARGWGTCTSPFGGHPKPHAVMGVPQCTSIQLTRHNNGIFPSRIRPSQTKVLRQCIFEGPRRSGVEASICDACCSWTASPGELVCSNPDINTGKKGGHSRVKQKRPSAHSR